MAGTVIYRAVVTFALLRGLWWARLPVLVFIRDNATGKRYPMRVNRLYRL